MERKDEIADIYIEFADSYFKPTEDQKKPDYAKALEFYQKALEIWEALEDRDSIVAVRLHRKIVEIATDTKWSVDAETYEEVSEISQASHSSLEESLHALENEPPHPETVRLLVVLSVDAWRIQTPPDWESAQHFAQSAVDMAEQLDFVGI